MQGQSFIATGTNTGTMGQVCLRCNGLSIWQLIIWCFNTFLWGWEELKKFLESCEMSQVCRKGSTDGATSKAISKVILLPETCSSKLSIQPP